jgi:hypothetical protein
MKKTRLSAIQLDVLRKLASCEEPLAYSKGGYWSNQNQARHSQHHNCAPIWHTTKRAVDALERMGLLKQTNTSTNYPIGAYPALADRVLSAKGLALATDSEEPMRGLVEAVVAWFGGKPLHFASFNVLGEKAWTKLLHEQLPQALSDGHSRLDFLTNTSALTTHEHDIYVQAGHESDALHELVHAAGVEPKNDREDGFVCEGITQAIAIEIAQQLDLDVRTTYEDHVDFVVNYLLEASHLSLKKLAHLYIDDGLEAIARHLDPENVPSVLACLERGTPIGALP